MSYDPRDHERRICDFPGGCEGSYNALAVLCGEEPARGWIRHPGFGLDMCGPHAAIVWGPHRDRHRASGSAGPVCGCGAPLEAAGPHLKDLADAYLRHLAALFVTDDPTKERA